MEWINRMKINIDKKTCRYIRQADIFTATSRCKQKLIMYHNGTGYVIAVVDSNLFKRVISLAIKEKPVVELLLPQKHITTEKLMFVMQAFAI